MSNLSDTNTPAAGVENKNERGALRQWAFMVLVAMVFVTPEQAHAAAAQPWDNTVATITGIFTGGLARAIAILVIIGLGIAAFFGRLTLRLAGSFIVGIVLVFGSAAIADFFIAGARGA